MIFTKIKVDATIALFPSEDTVSERLKPTPGTSAVLQISLWKQTEYLWALQIHTFKS